MKNERCKAEITQEICMSEVYSNLNGLFYTMTQFSYPNTGARGKTHIC